jgi:hypothetical protein
MLPNEQEPNKKKKKAPLFSKMGLTEGSVEKAPSAPPMAQPGIFPGSAAGELNERSQEEVVSSKIQGKLSDRKGALRGR